MDIECLHVSMWTLDYHSHRFGSIFAYYHSTWICLHVCLLSLTWIWLHAHILSLTSSHITLVLWFNCILNKTNNKWVAKWINKWTKGDKSAKKQLEKTAKLLTLPNSCIITHLILMLCFSLSLLALWQLTIFSSRGASSACMVLNWANLGRVKWAKNLIFYTISTKIADITII